MTEVTHTHSYKRDAVKQNKNSREDFAVNHSLKIDCKFLCVPWERLARDFIIHPQRATTFFTPNTVTAAAVAIVHGNETSQSPPQTCSSKPTFYQTPSDMHAEKCLKITTKD